MNSHLDGMRDKLTQDWFPSTDDAPPDPLRAARQGLKPALPKRFYERAAVEERDGAFVLLLDGKSARTPAQNLLAVPTRALGNALAEEWQRQEAEIDPRVMPVTRIVNSAIDGVRPQREAVIADLVRYAASDLVCYRAGEPDRLVKEQCAAWDPILTWAREALGVSFLLSEGVVHVLQPEAAVAAVRARLESIDSPFRLAALHAMTTLTGSVLIALAHAAGALGVEEGWRAAHVDERFQESLWGEDDMALQRRALREAEFRAASAVYAAS